MSEQNGPVQGLAINREDPTRFWAGLGWAVDYRGDVTIVLDDGTTTEGYIFDLAGDADDGSIKLISRDSPAPREIPTSSIVEVTFSGKDTAEGKSFETWIEKYVQKKIAGEQASIECESLDD